MRVSKLEKASVMCEYPGCAETATFVLCAPVQSFNGKALAAYCDKHSIEAIAISKNPPARPNRRPIAKGGLPLTRKAAS
jgi:hypothetical protein